MSFYYQPMANDKGKKREVLEKLYEVKRHLSRGGRPRHSDRCMIEMDPEYYGPCTCGASGSQADYDRPIRLLDEAIDDLL